MLLPAGFVGRVGRTSLRLNQLIELIVSGVSILDGRITLTRASTGGVFNSSGLYTTAATDQPRYDYNPTTLEWRGLLLEGARTNLLLWNRDLTNAAWTASSVTTAKTATGIDGVANSATTLTATGANGTVLQAIVSGSAARATTAYVKRRTGSGTIDMTQDGGTTWTPVTVTADWTRVGPASATVTNPSVGFRIATSGDAIDVDYVQLESATFPSSAILTTTAAATRASDLAQILDLATIGYNQSAGTIMVEFELMSGANASGTIADFSDGPVTDRITLRQSVTANSAVAEMVDGGSTQQQQPVTGFTAGIVCKIAYTWELNNVAVSANGGVPVVDTSAIMPTVDKLVLGSRAGGLSGFLWLRKITYIPRRVSNAELQAM